MSARHGVLALAFASVSFLACGCGEEDFTGPPTLHYGQDICAHCGMIVSDERFAAAVVLWPDDDEPRTLAFDDVADVFEWEAANPGQHVFARWTHDYDTQEWIRAERATFVVSDQIRTPMGSGVAAASSREAARELLKRFPGRTLDFDSVRAEVIGTARPEGADQGTKPGD